MNLACKTLNFTALYIEIIKSRVRLGNLFNTKGNDHHGLFALETNVIIYQTITIRGVYMEVSIPSQFNRFSMYEFINQTIDQDMQPRDHNITINFSSLSFIEPSGVTILSNVTHWLIKRGVQVFYNYPNQPLLNSAFCYLDDSQFFKRHVGECCRKNAAVRETTIPLELVAYKDSYQWFQRTEYWLSNRLKVSTRSLSNIKVCFQEIFNNINDHSQESIGCVFAQHFPRNNEIKVVISDFGIGIPVNIQKIHPSLNDAEAIEKATEEGFSTKSSPRNRGAGLDTLIQNVVNNNQGAVYIHSNHGILDCKHTGTGVSMTKNNSYGFYPGTLLEVVFRTDTIDNILDDEEEFEW